jgi:hypothetical protein
MCTYICIYVGTNLTDRNCMQKETKSRLNSGNACYYSVEYAKPQFCQLLCMGVKLVLSRYGKCID